MATIDVTVVGAGVFGLSVAWACVQRGARVQVIDPHGVAAGASGGIVGALAPHVPENWNAKKQFQLESLLMAGRFWGDVADASGLASGYARSGRLQPLADAAALDLAQRREITAPAFWETHAIWSVIPDTGNTSWTPPSPTGQMIHDTLSALIHPACATRALAAAVQAAGAPVLSSGAAKGAVVWATGWAGLQELSAQTGANVGSGVKGQAALLAFDAAGQPQIFADGLHIIPHGDGTVAIGSTSENSFDAPDTTDGQLDLLVAKARTAMPLLASARVLQRWAGVRPRARSRAPMIGPHPLIADAYVANGGFKIGFGMAPKVGQVMADLILENRNTIPEDFLPAASLPRLPS